MPIHSRRLDQAHTNNGLLLHSDRPPTISRNSSIDGCAVCHAFRRGTSDRDILGGLAGGVGSCALGAQLGESLLLVILVVQFSPLLVAVLLTCWILSLLQRS